MPTHILKRSAPIVLLLLLVIPLELHAQQTSRPHDWKPYRNGLVICVNHKPQLVCDPFTCTAFEHYHGSAAYGFAAAVQTAGTAPLDSFTVDINAVVESQVAHSHSWGAWRIHQDGVEFRSYCTGCDKFESHAWAPCGEWSSYQYCDTESDYLICAHGCVNIKVAHEFSNGFCSNCRWQAPHFHWAHVCGEGCRTYVLLNYTHNDPRHRCKSSCPKYARRCSSSVQYNSVPELRVVKGYPHGQQRHYCDSWCSQHGISTNIGDALFWGLIGYGLHKH